MLSALVRPCVGRLVYYGWEGGLPNTGSGGVPVSSKLLVWARGEIISGSDVIQDPDENQDPDVSYRYYRRDIKNGYHIFCTPNGDTITDHWDGATSATYLLHHEILLIDPAPLKTADALDTGPFFFDGSGNPVQRTLGEMITHSSSSDIFFMTQHNGYYEFRHYNEVLTGQELIDANAY
jgi:hypothetical protein